MHYGSCIHTYARIFMSYYVYCLPPIEIIQICNIKNKVDYVQLKWFKLMNILYSKH